MSLVKKQITDGQLEWLQNYYHDRKDNLSTAEQHVLAALDELLACRLILHVHGPDIEKNQEMETELEEWETAKETWQHQVTKLRGKLNEQRQEIERLTKERELARSLHCEVSAVLDWVVDAINDKPVSDFAESFPLVRMAVDLRDELNRLKKIEEAAAEVITGNDQPSRVQRDNDDPLETALNNLRALL